MGDNIGDNEVKDIKNDVKRHIDENKDRNLMIAAQAILSIIERNDKRKDPVVRNLLFVDKILSLLDTVLAGYIQTADDVSDNTKSEVKKAVNYLRVKFEELEDHIEQPYDPSHPYGNRMMKEAGEHFSKASQVLKPLDCSIGSSTGRSIHKPLYDS